MKVLVQGQRVEGIFEFAKVTTSLLVVKMYNDIFMVNDNMKSTEYMASNGCGELEADPVLFALFCRTEEVRRRRMKKPGNRRFTV